MVFTLDPPPGLGLRACAKSVGKLDAIALAPGMGWEPVRGEHNRSARRERGGFVFDFFAQGRYTNREAFPYTRNGDVYEG